MKKEPCGSGPATICTISLKAVEILLLLNVVVFLYAACRSLFCLGDVTIPEGAVVYPIKGLLTGGWPLYRDYTVSPYSTTPYTPLFYLASAALALLTSKSVYAIYICCRMLTLAATFGAAFLVRKITLLLRKDAGAAPSPLPLAFLLPFTILILIAWGFSARPDMLAILLSLAGIYCYLRNPQSQRMLCCGGFILACAWWCKQSFLAAPAAVFLTLLGTKEFRRCGMFLLSYLAMLATLVGATEYLSHGWFIRNVIFANVTRLQVDQVYWLTSYAYLNMAPFITGMALLACTVFFKPIAGKPKARCLLLYLVASVSLSTLACMKEGAYLNYMMEPLFIASVMAALAVERLLMYRYTAPLMPALLLAALAFSYYCAWHGDGALENALSADIDRENREIQAVLDKMNALPHDVLTSRSMLAVRSTRPMLGADLFNTRYLEEAGKLSTMPLAERIERQELSAIVAPERCQPSALDCLYWPPLVRQAILDKYEPRETLYNEVFWYPRGK